MHAARARCIKEAMRARGPGRLAISEFAVPSPQLCMLAGLLAVQSQAMRGEGEFDVHKATGEV